MTAASWNPWHPYVVVVSTSTVTIGVDYGYELSPARRFAAHREAYRRETDREIQEFLKAAKYEAVRVSRLAAIDGPFAELPPARASLVDRDAKPWFVHRKRCQQRI
jgi:hypothetical protein